MLELRNISKKNVGKDYVLKNINLKFKKGRIYGLLSLNPLETTTMIKLISKYDKPSSGKILINNREVKNGFFREKIKRKIIANFGCENIFPNLTVFENIFLGNPEEKFWSALHMKKMLKMVMPFLKDFNLEDSYSKKAFFLTREKWFLIAIIRIVLINVDYYLLDRITESMSISNFKKFKKILDSIKKQNRSIIIVPDNVNQVFDLCDEVVVLRNGSVAYCSSIEDVTVNELHNIMNNTQYLINQAITNNFSNLEKNIIHYNELVSGALRIVDNFCGNARLFCRYYDEKGVEQFGFSREIIESERKIILDQNKILLKGKSGEQYTSFNFSKERCFIHKIVFNKKNYGDVFIFSNNKINSETFTRILSEFGRFFNQINIELSKRDQLKKLNRELQVHKDNLEELVKIRTDELKNVNISLASAEIKMRTLLESSPDTIVNINKEYIIDYQNRLLFEYKKKSVGESVFIIYEKSYHKVVKKKIDHVFATGEREIIEDRKANINNEIKYFQDRFVSLSESEKNDKIMIIITDITKRKEAEQQLRDMQKKLIETARMAGKAEVATSVLHNIGNALNSINITTALIKDGIETSQMGNINKLAELFRENMNNLNSFFDTEKGKMVGPYILSLADCYNEEKDLIVTKILRLKNLIKHVTEILRLQQSYSKIGGVEEKELINDIIYDATKMTEESLSKYFINFEVLGPVLSKAYFDRHRLLQIFINLISNSKDALLAKGGDGKKITITVIKISEDRICIDFVDNGIGIPKDNLRKIFVHGFTTKKKGHGFGLQSAANAAAEMGGSLKAYSGGHGKGAKFVLELPFKVG